MTEHFEVWPMFLSLNVISALEGTLKDLCYRTSTQKKAILCQKC